MKLLSSALPAAILILATHLTPLIRASPLIVFVGGSGSGACNDGYNQCSDCTVDFRAVWDEAGLRRYRFTFNGTALIHDLGQDFLTRIRCHDGNTVANNWQCWGPNPDGTWTFDVSELDGPEGAKNMNRAIQDVVGRSPNIPL